MPWPTLAERTDLWLDDFDGSLDARWTQVTSGGGSVSLTDSTLRCARPAATDAAYIYHALDKTDDELWLFCVNVQGDGYRRLFVVESTTTPGTPRNFDTSATVLLCQLSKVGANYFIFLEYFSSTSVRTAWRPDTQAWVTSLGAVDQVLWNECYLDDYLIVGLEINGSNDRFRLLAMDNRPQTSGQYTAAAMPGSFRISQLTDWVDWDDVQFNTNLYLFPGCHPYNDTLSDTTAQLARTEWVRREYGTVRDAWVNGETSVADWDYTIRRHYSYGEIFVPQDRTTEALQASGSGWDDEFVKDQMVLEYGGNYYMFYAGADLTGRIHQIGVAKSSTVDGTWTKAADTAQDTNQGTVSYAGNGTTTAEIRDTGQDFSTWETAAPGAAAYWVRVVNSDGTIAYGYLGDANDTGNQDCDVYQDYGLTTRGWNGHRTGKTASTYIVHAIGENTNPIIPRVSGTDDDQSFFPFVLEDQTEPDAGKRFKMLYTAYVGSGPEWRIYYADAPHPFGPWSNRVEVLGLGGVGDEDEQGCSNATPVYYNQQWEIWYGGLDNASPIAQWTVCRSTGPTLTSQTKDAGNPILQWIANGTEAISTDASGRTLTVTDTTGFTAGRLLIATQNNDSDDWSLSRVRKVTSGTQLELYGGLHFNFATTAGHLKSADAFRSMYPRVIARVGDVWRMWGVTFKPYADEASFDAFSETTTVWEHSGDGPSDAAFVLVDEINPPVMYTRYGHERSSENVTMILPAFAGLDNNTPLSGRLRRHRFTASHLIR